MADVLKHGLTKLLVLLVIAHVVLFFLNTDETNPQSKNLENIGRDQALVIINGQEYACDSVVTISRESKHVEVGCDVNNHFVAYAIYKDDYGFNKVKPM